MTTTPHDQTSPDPQEAAERLERGLGRRAFVQTALATGALLAAGVATAGPAVAAPRTRLPREVLQPGTGPIDGQVYLPSRPDEVLWGYLPRTGDAPVARVRSGGTITIDTVSHEGILEDQGRDPVAWFGSQGVPREQVLDDAVAIAAEYARHPRSFDADGPHVVTGPVHVEGARPGDVLKIELLTALPRVPYGVVSSRHGKGALAAAFAGAPGDITAAEVMPTTRDGRGTGNPLEYGNVSIFTPLAVRGGAVRASLPGGPRGTVSWPVDPFAGLMAVATVADAAAVNDPLVNSIPPTVGGGNIDVNLLGVGSAFYVPVVAPGALFSVGDPHMSMGSGEVALTALEGSLRLTFRLTVCRKGTSDAPSVAFSYPFGETPESWLPIGLSDPDGSRGGQAGDLDVANRRAVVHALDFLQNDLGMDRAVAYAYLSAAVDFEVSQVVDRTVGVHGVIPKSHFR
ncbi:acetamidase [Blastococcus sp. MG754426]|uniref:acetamidase/formamidase family protein n=1 Tax=unclassified Blastococcus TaxID=2619396 RepID=UPI001EF157AA|nr:MULTISPECIES: acetamidase/formamidase family protein [unclassified Blastococcus]MCF6508988.1 acetamidase [Blastococcus sp. MG754426]MCF6513575.1 acetamidase [Blastococcus sp. MG754427]MCF6736459.1 acetamidase [Blastococcus sp. KM273129]